MTFKQWLLDHGITPALIVIMPQAQLMMLQEMWYQERNQKASHANDREPRQAASGPIPRGSYDRRRACPLLSPGVQ